MKSGDIYSCGRGNPECAALLPGYILPTKFKQGAHRARGNDKTMLDPTFPGSSYFTRMLSSLTSTFLTAGRCSMRSLNAV